MNMKARLIEDYYVSKSVCFKKGDVVPIVNTLFSNNGYLCGVLVGAGGQLVSVETSFFVVETDLNESCSSAGNMLTEGANISSTRL